MGTHLLLSMLCCIEGHGQEVGLGAGPGGEAPVCESSSCEALPPRNAPAEEAGTPGANNNVMSRYDTPNLHNIQSISLLQSYNVFNVMHSLVLKCNS